MVRKEIERVIAMYDKSVVKKIMSGEQVDWNDVEPEGVLSILELYDNMYYANKKEEKEE